MARNTEVLESGNIYFCYRPKVDDETVEGLEDVQRFHIILRPDGADSYRLLTIGQKHLPDIEEHGQQTWGFVDDVTHDPDKLESALKEEHYQTKTRGERTRPAARPSGEGVYDIVRHGGHTHLAYALELPKKPGNVQNELEIEPEASYVLQIKNPQQGAPKGVGLSRRQQADFPKKLQDRFEDRRFIGADPPDFLDYPGAELLLIAASENVSEELGIELEPEHETEATADMLRDLHMRKSEHPVEPLFEGRWR